MISDFSQRVRAVPNVAEVIANTIEELIVSAQVRPGEFLRQEDIAQQFGVSRIPVRDALHILERRGLVETVQRRGVRVRTISRKAVRDLYGLREALETYAGRLACQLVSQDDLARLKAIVDQQRAAIDQKDLSDFIAKDELFHQEICALSENEELIDALTSIWARINQVRSAARVDPRWGQRWAERAIARHETILEALAARDPERMTEVVQTILHKAADELADKLENLRWLGESDGALERGTS